MRVSKSVNKRKRRFKAHPSFLSELAILVRAFYQLSRPMLSTTFLCDQLAHL